MSGASNTADLPQNADESGASGNAAQETLRKRFPKKSDHGWPTAEERRRTSRDICGNE